MFQSSPEGHPKNCLLTILTKMFMFFSILTQITTSLEQQATESSLCDRNTTAGISTQGEEAAIVFFNKQSVFPHLWCIEWRERLDRYCKSSIDLWKVNM